jgi:demethylmenaquinone methyltransferase/2-methoxy-6-polyprenyl-1,4-benzoquinol methylase
VADALGASVVVLDPTPVPLTRVPKHARVRGQRGYAGAIPYPDDPLDAVVAPNTFHNLSDPMRAVEEFLRVVRPGGRVVVREFDPSSPTRLLERFERLLGGSE